MKSHSNVRRLIRDNCRISFVSYIGNAFTGVYCPCILLGIQKLTTITSNGSTTGTDVGANTVSTDNNDSAHTDSDDSVSMNVCSDNTI